MKVTIAAAVLCAATVAYAEDRKVEIVYAESITVCEENTGPPVAQAFEEGGFDPMIGVVHMFSGLGMCEQYQGHFALAERKEQYVYGTKVFNIGDAILEDGRQVIVFQMRKAF